jgi:hypothetical protein
MTALPAWLCQMRASVEKPIKFFSWLVGQRVSRKDADDLGTVIETMPKLKVRWDRGQTSYFDRERPANVRKIAGLL